MNYFLHYDNSNPLFIGGMHHGQKHRVPLKEKHWRLYQRPEVDWGMTLSRFAQFGPSEAVQAWNYVALRCIANGREFRLFAHESLDADSAFMLLMSTCAANLGLLKRIKELEDENRTLKNLIALMAAEQ